MISHFVVSTLALKKVVVPLAAGLSLAVAVAIDPTVFAAAVVTVITALTGAALLIIDRLGKMKLELMESQQKLLASQAVLTEKTDVIKGRVDGMATASATKRTADEETIAALRAQVAKVERTAELLAQSTAAVANSAAQGPVAPVQALALAPVLQSIDQNTKEISVNTKRTDAAIADLKESKD